MVRIWLMANCYFELCYILPLGLSLFAHILYSAIVRRGKILVNLVNSQPFANILPINISIKCTLKIKLAGVIIGVSS